MRPKNYLKAPGFTFENMTPVEAVDAAVAWLKEPPTTINKANPGKGYHSLANFAIYRDDGSLHQETLNNACHADLSSNWNRGERGNEKACVALYCKNENHEDWRPYYDYLTRRSFAAEFILAIEDTGFVVSSDIPAGLLHAIAMMSRVPRQFPQELFTQFNSLVDDGIPEDLAYFAVFNTTAGGLDDALHPSLDHRPWQLPTISGMKQFLNGEFIIPEGERTPFRNTRSSSCSGFIEGRYSVNSFISELWGKPEFVAALMEYRSGKTTGSYRPPNPFEKKKNNLPRHGECSRKEVYEFVLPYCLKNGVFS